MHVSTIVVVLSLVVVTGLLAWVTESVHQRNENHLLDLQVQEVGAVVTAALPSIEIPLASASELADATDGNVVEFQHYMAAYLGRGGPFVAASLWQVTPGGAQQSTTVGSEPELDSNMAQAESVVASGASTVSFKVTNLLHRSQPRLGYSYSGPTGTGAWVVYVESALPKDRRLHLSNSSAFSQLNYALYLGKTTNTSDLLAASVAHVPITTTHAAANIKFANTYITVVGTPKEELGSSLLGRLPWIIGVVGLAVALLAGFATESLVRRRIRAETLAYENQKLYTEQRGIAQTLQQALLPSSPSDTPGLSAASRYIAGTGTADIGGDWFDVIPCDNEHVLFVVGDVSGRGIEAATIMARLHFAIRAYAAQGDSPSDIVGKLQMILDVTVDNSFASMLCGRIDVGNHELVLVNAGHPPPFIRDEHGGHYVDGPIGPPVGIAHDEPYEESTIRVPPRSTLVAFTDGLVERRGESIDNGLGRVADVLIREGGEPLTDLLSNLVTTLMPEKAGDDTAILALRWEG